MFVGERQWDFLSFGSTLCGPRMNPSRVGVFRVTCFRPQTGQFVTIQNDVQSNGNGRNRNLKFELAEVEILAKGKYAMGNIFANVYW